MRVQLSSVLLCALVAVSQLAFAQEEVAPGVFRVGTIQNPEIAESSGIIPSKRNKSAFWTHNDGGPDYVYAITREGESLGQWKLKDVDLENIEDIAIGGGRLYVADIGNNTGSRDMIRVVAIPEPFPTKSGEVKPARIYNLTYPGDPFDAESFFIHRGSGYIISKELSGGEARLYRFPLAKRGAKIELQKLSKLDVGDQTRGADVSPDGKRLAVITGSGAYLFLLEKGRIPTDGVIEPSLFVPFDNNSMEGCAFTTEGLLVTSESRDLYLFNDPLFQLPAKGRRR